MIIVDSSALIVQVIVLKPKGKNTVKGKESEPNQEPLLKASIKILANITKENILSKGSMYKHREQRHLVMATLAKKTVIEEDINNQAFYSVFMASAKSIIIKIKISDLLKEPSNQRELKAHLKKTEFLLAYREELWKLDSKGIFEVIKEDTEHKISNISLLSLIWVFKYKGDSDRNLIKYKSRLVVREDLQTTQEDIYTIIIAIQSF